MPGIFLIYIKEMQRHRRDTRRVLHFRFDLIHSYSWRFFYVPNPAPA